jgi:hypothetical protein
VRQRRRESGGDNERLYLGVGARIFFISSFEGSQTVPARPSGKDVYLRESMRPEGRKLSWDFTVHDRN